MKQQFIHDLSRPKQQTLLSELVKVLNANITNEEVLPSFDFEITKFWSAQGLSVPESFLDYDYAPYDNCYNDGTLDTDKLLKSLIDESMEYEDELSEVVDEVEFYLEDYRQ